MFPWRIYATTPDEACHLVPHRPAAPGRTRVSPLVGAVRVPIRVPRAHARVFVPTRAESAGANAGRSCFGVGLRTASWSACCSPSDLPDWLLDVDCPEEEQPACISEGLQLPSLKEGRGIGFVEAEPSPAARHCLAAVKV